MTETKIAEVDYLELVAQMLAKKKILLTGKDIKLAKRLWDNGSTVATAARLIFLNHHSD